MKPTEELALLNCIHNSLEKILDFRRNRLPSWIDLGDYYWQGSYHMGINAEYSLCRDGSYLRKESPSDHKRRIHATMSEFLHMIISTGLDYEICAKEDDSTSYLIPYDYYICASDKYVDELIKNLNQTRILCCCQAMTGIDVMDNAIKFKNTLIERHADILDRIASDFHTKLVFRNVNFSVNKCGILLGDSLESDFAYGPFWSFHDNGMSEFSDVYQAVGMGLAIAEKIKDDLPKNECFIYESVFRLNSDDFDHIYFFPISYQDNGEREIEYYKEW